MKWFYNYKLGKVELRDLQKLEEKDLPEFKKEALECSEVTRDIETIADSISLNKDDTEYYMFQENKNFDLISKEKMVYIIRMKESKRIFKVKVNFEIEFEKDDSKNE